MAGEIRAFPFDFPLEGCLGPAETAVMVIDMQADFCASGGYMDRAGADISELRRPIGTIAKVLDAARAAGLTIVHTRETFQPDLSDAQPHRRWRPSGGVTVGDSGPLGRALVAGEPGWEIIAELAPEAGEAVFDKASYGPFATTKIGEHLEDRGIRNLVIMGITTDCCIHTTVREALDRGFETLVLEDGCAAGTAALHDHAIALLRRSSGVFGATTSASDFLNGLAAATDIERERVADG